jgi:hypothetical protein
MLGRDFEAIESDSIVGLKATDLSEMRDFETTNSYRLIDSEATNSC